MINLISCCMSIFYHEYESLRQSCNLSVCHFLLLGLFSVELNGEANEFGAPSPRVFETVLHQELRLVILRWHKSGHSLHFAMRQHRVILHGERSHQWLTPRRTAHHRSCFQPLAPCQRRSPLSKSLHRTDQSRTGHHSQT